MEFVDSIKQFSERVSKIKDTIATEEATKMSLIVPMFQILGYDIFNSLEFCPEYVADVGIKKGEKVDYAILNDGEPEILIECKSCSEKLDNHSSQLFRYFGTSSAKFGILTNGIIYKFFTDLEESNKMDMVPFLEIDLINLREHAIVELKKFKKDSFDKDTIFSTAEELKYTALLKALLAEELEEPSEEFVRVLVSRVYEGLKTQKIIDKFSPIVKKSFSGFVNELVNQKISAALVHNEEPAEQEKEPLADEQESKIVTTDMELEAYYVIRGILTGIASASDIVYRDTESYFGILYQNNNRKPICRLKLTEKNKQLLLPDENKKFEKYSLATVDELYDYREQLIDVLQRYIGNND